MSVGRDVMRSRVARRVVALFLLCALIPVTGLAILSYQHLKQVLISQGRTHLAQLNEAYANALYDRLVTADAELREIPIAQRSGATPWSRQFTH